MVLDNWKLKAQIKWLELVLKNNYPDLIKDSPDLILKLYKMNDFRNYLAHGMTVMGKSSLDSNAKSFTLVKYNKNGKLTERRITIDIVRKRASDVLDVTMKLNEIHVMISK